MQTLIAAGADVNVVDPASGFTAVRSLLNG
jgi:hypothetical protein